MTSVINTPKRTPPQVKLILIDIEACPHLVLTEQLAGMAVPGIALALTGLILSETKTVLKPRKRPDIANRDIV